MKIISSVFLLAFVGATIAQENHLQCYVCDDCNELEDSMMKSCGPEPTTTTTTTTTTTATTTLATDSTMGDLSTLTSTTIGVVETTTVAATEPLTPTTTVAATEPPTPTTAEAGAEPTTSPTTAVVGAEATTAAPAESATEAPTSEQPQQQQVNQEVVAGPAQQEVPNEQAPAPAMNISGSGVSPANSAAFAADLPQQLSPAALLLRNYRSISRASRADAGGVSYACYKIDMSDNNSDAPKWKRGCVAVPAEKNGCQVVREENELPADGVDSCRHCTTDGCNSSAALQLSLGALLGALIIKFLI